MPTTANTFAQAKATGVAQCGLCAGEAAAKLHNAGCTDAEISNWCSGSTASANANANAKANANSNARVLLAGSSTSQSGLPAILAIDPDSGEVCVCGTCTTRMLVGLCQRHSQNLSVKSKSFPPHLHLHLHLHFRIRLCICLLLLHFAFHQPHSVLFGHCHNNIYLGSLESSCRRKRPTRPGNKCKRSTKVEIVSRKQPSRRHCDCD